MQTTKRFTELNVISIDPSLRCTGIYATKDDLTYTFLVSEKDRMKSLAIVSRFWNNVANEKFDFVLIENYAFSRRSISVTALAEVGGIIRASFAKHDIPIIEVPSVSWKKWSGFGKTRPKDTVKEKRAYIEYGEKISGRHFDSSDEVDAYMIYTGAVNALEYAEEHTETSEWINKLAEAVKKI